MNQLLSIRPALLLLLLLLILLFLHLSVQKLLLSALRMLGLKDLLDQQVPLVRKVSKASLAILALPALLGLHRLLQAPLELHQLLLGRLVQQDQLVRLARKATLRL
jgi:hypothetical protein